MSDNTLKNTQISNEFGQKFGKLLTKMLSNYEETGKVAEFRSFETKTNSIETEKTEIDKTEKSDIKTEETKDIEDMEELEEENKQQLAHLNNLFLLKPEILDDAILKLLNISKDDSSSARVFDTNPNGLSLIHYVSSSNENVNHLRGVIVATNENPPRVVCKSFPYTPEILSKDFNMDEEIISKSKIMEGYEGTILRVFHYADEWFISTHKKIDGKSSRWSSPTFGSLFKECMGLTANEELSFDHLNKNYCYVFLMSHPKNSLVCENDKAMLYHIVTYDSSDDMKIAEQNAQPKVERTEYPTYVRDLNTSDDVTSYVDKMPWNKFSGLVLFLPDGKMCKVINNDYYTKRQIRGNEPNLRIRYFQLETMKNMSSNDLVTLLPNKAQFFKKIKKDIETLVHYLYKNYEFAFINGNFKKLAREEFVFMKHLNIKNFKLKGTVLTTEQKQMIKNQIKQDLDLCSPITINAMIRHMLYQRKN